MKKHITIKNVLLFVLVMLIVSAFSLWFANAQIEQNAEGKTYDAVEKVQHFKSALLLGTSKYTKGGALNLYYTKRIKATASLYKEGKLDYIIISGDNSTKSYDEPTDMKRDLVAAGIDSNKIYLDYAGFRTFDSMVRCKEIFSQDSVLVISQQFHNERAIYIGEQVGMYVRGFNAADVSVSYGKWTMLREAFARVKVLVDFAVGTESKFLGEKVKLGLPQKK